MSYLSEIVPAAPSPWRIAHHPVWRNPGADELFAGLGDDETAFAGDL